MAEGGRENGREGSFRWTGREARGCGDGVSPSDDAGDGVATAGGSPKISGREVWACGRGAGWGELGRPKGQGDLAQGQDILTICHANHSFLGNLYNFDRGEGCEAAVRRASPLDSPVGPVQSLHEESVERLSFVPKGLLR